MLATDLLIGIGIGIATKFAIHLFNGVSIKSLLFPYLAIEEDIEGHVVIRAHESAVFSNWIAFRRQVVAANLAKGKPVEIDMSGTHLVDHSVMEKLHELEDEFHRAGVDFRVAGLDNHRGLSAHPHATRKRSLAVIPTEPPKASAK